MSAFTEDFVASGWLDLLAQFGDAATYTPTGGVATAITLIPENRMQGNSQDKDRLVETNSLRVLFLKSDIGGTVTTEEDTVTIDGVVHLVMKVEKDVAGIVTVLVQDLDTVAIQSEEREIRRG